MKPQKKNGWMPSRENILKHPNIVWLCSAHFNPNDFVENLDRLVLKEGIVPSNFNCTATPFKKFGKKKITTNVLQNLVI